MPHALEGLPVRPTKLPGALACALLWAGCGASHVTTGPEPTLARYAHALRARDQATVAALSADSPAQRSEETRAALMEANGTELAELAERLEAAPPSALTVRARQDLARGDHVSLIHEDGGWRLDGELLGEPALREPREAAEALRRALAQRDLRAFEAVLTRAARAALEEEIGHIIEGLSDPDALEIVIEGDRARVIAPNGTTLELVLEAGEWRVRDLPQPAQ